MRFLGEAARAFPWAGLELGTSPWSTAAWSPRGAGRGRCETRSRVVDHEARGRRPRPGLDAGREAHHRPRRGGEGRGPRPAPPGPLRAALPDRDHAARRRAPRPEGSVAEQTLAAVREEMAIHLADVVLRRTDLGTAGPPAPGDLEAAAAAMASALGWDERKARAEREAVG